ncbi:hypothetical protein [Streptosporangium subroseum]|uniref:hypothetical protein n=1 Tax=Streptosporangium subroseum TaxID=106412 RepID=UPI000B76BBF6|nr:hypothetical protein [Streptosporangium subroseum]
METILDSIVDFAVTGQIGTLRLGMPAAEVGRLFGGGTGLTQSPPAGAGSVGFKDGSLELWIREERLLLLGLTQ